MENGLRFTIEENILKGKKVSNEINYANLGEFILNTLEDSPDFVGQIDAVTDEEYTYKKMRDRSVRCALWMKSQGVLPGDLVTICSHNQLDAAMPCFAALYLGAAFNPLDVVMNAKEIRHMLNITKPKVAFVGEESATVVAEAAQEASLDLKIVVFGRVVGFLDFENIIAEPGVDEVKNFQCTPLRSSDQIAAAMCSSGTTGLPKCVALSHEAILNQMLPSKKFGMTGKTCLSFSSLYWISGTLIMFLSLHSKITKIITPPFDGNTACEIAEKYRVGWLFLNSSSVNRLLKSGALERHNLSQLKRVCYGGSPLGLTSREALVALLPNALITSGYGCTEFGGLLSLQTAESKPGSTGQIVDNAQLKVIDPETGRVLGANERGEILLKGTGMMSFYWGNPEATAKTLDEEGWLHTGDLGYYDEDGEIFVVDRLKELIKYQCYHIYPIELESVILSHPGVKEVAVVGLPHPVDDEHPVAFVVKAEDFTATGKEVTERELMDLVAAELSDTKRLRGGVRFLDSLPKSPSEKIRRKQLRDLAAKSVGTTQSG